MPEDDVARVLSYHTRSKHTLERYAAGPEALDWDSQPAAFRDWSDTHRTQLPHTALPTDIAWREIAAARTPLPFDAHSLGSFFRLSLGLTAWKEYAGTRWSLRAHPSSGNLHPTESWLIASGLDGIPDGLHHYHNLHHALERRAWNDGASTPGAWLGFSSIHWREAWKYGERAFRYCQLDMGHVLAAVSYAAALHGWRPQLLQLDSQTVAHMLGTDRTEDFAQVETEEAEVILALHRDMPTPATDWQHWAGHPALLDPHPMYRWPVIDEVAAATHGAPVLPDTVVADNDTVHDDGDILAAQVILKRRSAQAFDGQSVMPHAMFQRMLAVMLTGGSPIWSLWNATPRVHPVLLVHRVEGMAPGMYVLPRTPQAMDTLRTAMRDSFTWQRADDGLPLFQLVTARAEKIARTLSCHQHIASHCAFTCLMVAEFEQAVTPAPSAYRHLHWEAGMLGHVLTLAAEAASWRGTGIGCFFDDAVHEVLGLKDGQFQVIYHYAIGKALDDPRILTLPAYPDAEPTP